MVTPEQDRSRRGYSSASARGGASYDGASAGGGGSGGGSIGTRPKRISRSPQHRRFVEAHLRMDTNTSHKPINTKVPGLRNSKLIRLKENRRITTRRRNQR